MSQPSRKNALVSTVAVLSIFASSSVLLAQTFPVPIPDCWRLNCWSSTSVLSCRNCCISNCPNAQPDLCRAWCDVRIY